jgi:hypothetical protein
MHSTNALFLLNKKIPLVLELLQVIVQETQLFVLESFKLDIKGSRSFINASVKIFIVVGEFFLLVLSQPLSNLIFNFQFLFRCLILSFWLSRLKHDFTTLQTQSQALGI